MQTKSNMIEVDSAKHTDAHSRGIMCAYWAAPSAVAARYLMHLSMDGCRSCRETLSAALLRGCYRTARAQLDLLRTPAISGHHQQRVVRPAALEQRAHSLRATVASLRRWLRCAGEASRASTLWRVHTSPTYGSLPEGKDQRTSLLAQEAILLWPRFVSERNGFRPNVVW